MTNSKIPSLSVAGLFGDDPKERQSLDNEIAKAAHHIGFLLLKDLPDWASLSPEKRRFLLSIFSLPPEDVQKLWLRKFNAMQPNIYRGWFPLQDGFPTYKEGIDIGPDLVSSHLAVEGGDPLREKSPLPPEHLLPQWRSAAAEYYQAMHRLSGALMQSIARGLGLVETQFDSAFEQGISTLRFIHYPIRTPQSLQAISEEAMWTEYQGVRRYLTGRPHADTGFITLLAQDGVSGLQAKHHDGTWLDIEPLEGSLVVNFGKVLQRWTGGRVKATEHRVLGLDQPRNSIPFFYEPRVDAIIAPLPLTDVASFEPFYYGDHLWETITTQNVEFKGIGPMRQAMGKPPST